MTPFLTKTEDNPDNVPAAAIEVQCGREGFRKVDCRKRGAIRHVGYDPCARIKAMMLSLPLPVALACRQTISTADARSELAKLDLPTLILQGNKMRARRCSSPVSIVLTHLERFLGDVIALIAE
jgi:non-heme chloroperoxidase